MKVSRFYLLCSATAVAIVCSCKTAAVREPVYGGKHLAHWLDELSGAETEEQYARASNAIYRIGSNAVPFLMTVVQSTNIPPASDVAGQSSLRALRVWVPIDESSARVAFACRVLGPVAQPVIDQLITNLSSPVWLKPDQAAGTLLNMGSLGVVPLIKFLASPSEPIPFPKIGLGVIVGISGMIPDNPTDLVGTLLELHKTGTPDEREVALRLLKGALVYDLFEEDFNVLFPVLRRHMHGNDPELQIYIISYFERCAEAARAALPDLVRLSSEGDASVRFAANTAIAAIDPQQAAKSQRD